MAGPGANYIGEEEIKEVMEVMRSKYLFRYGFADDPSFQHKVHSFEQDVQSKFGVKHAVATNSGTSALAVAISAMGIGPGDEIIIPGYTYVASYSAAVFCGAVPVLAEIDESMTLDPKDIARHITRKTKAIMCVHMLGNSAELDAIFSVAKKHKLMVLEDSAQACGGSYKGKRLGTMGDVGVYSFNSFKIITCGDGGMVVTNSQHIYERAFAVHDQGHFPNRISVKENSGRALMGMNFRMPEVSGAILIAQLRKIDDILNHTRALKQHYKSILMDGVKGLKFRHINDEAGDCASVLAMQFDDVEIANKVAQDMGTKTCVESGWHVYLNMEHLLNKKQITIGPPFQSTEFPTDVEYKKGMLPNTDDILSRTVLVSIGVVQAPIGASFGVDSISTIQDVEDSAETLKKILNKYL